MVFLAIKMILWWLNVVCWGTLFQLVFETTDKKPATIAALLVDKWLRYFGPPLVIIADQGREFVGQPFFDMCTKHSILLHITNVRAPWENVRTERHGDLWKKLYYKTCWLQTPKDHYEESLIIAETARESLVQYVEQSIAETDVWPFDVYIPTIARSRSISR